ncbi:MAG: lasso peptide biosynthesis B2 protein [Thermoleophilia bacterium]
MSKLLRTIKRLRNPRDLKLFLQILLMLTFLPGKIRRHSIPDLLGRLDPGVAPTPRDQDRLMQTVGFTDSLLRYRIFQRYGKCLQRSLVLFRFLRRQGWPVEIHFGVRKTSEDEDESAASGGPDITGHSWLVLDGERFLEEPSQTHSYSTTYTYPVAP